MSVKHPYGFCMCKSLSTASTHQKQNHSSDTSYCCRGRLRSYRSIKASNPRHMRPITRSTCKPQIPVRQGCQVGVEVKNTLGVLLTNFEKWHILRILTMGKVKNMFLVLTYFEGLHATDLPIAYKVPPLPFPLPCRRLQNPVPTPFCRQHGMLSSCGSCGHGQHPLAPFELAQLHPTPRWRRGFHHCPRCFPGALPFEPLAVTLPFPLLRSSPLPSPYFLLSSWVRPKP